MSQLLGFEGGTLKKIASTLVKWNLRSIMQIYLSPKVLLIKFNESQHFCSGEFVECHLQLKDALMRHESKYAFGIFSEQIAVSLKNICKIRFTSVLVPL